MFNHFQDSSSLLEPDVADLSVTQKGRRGVKLIVPTVRMDALLSAGQLQCWFVKTDMQVSAILQFFLHLHQKLF